MICGSCKQNHKTVGDVRACYEATNVLPKPAKIQVTEPGMYKLGEDVFQVVFNKDKTHLYAKKLVASYSDGTVHKLDFEYDKGSIFKLEPEHRMTVVEVAKLGKLTGFCWVCRRELKVTKSIAAGIGPVCAKKV